MASYECRGKKKLWSVRFDIIENGKHLVNGTITNLLEKKMQNMPIEHSWKIMKNLNTTNMTIKI